MVPFGNNVAALFSYWLYALIFTGYAIAVMQTQSSWWRYAASLLVTLPLLHACHHMLACVMYGGCTRAPFAVLSLFYGALLYTIMTHGVR